MQRPVMPVCVTWTLEFKNESMQQLIDIRSQYSTGVLPSLHTHSIRHCHLTKATYSIHFSFQLQFLCFKHRWDPNHCGIMGGSWFSLLVRMDLGGANTTRGEGGWGLFLSWGERLGFLGNLRFAIKEFVSEMSLRGPKLWDIVHLVCCQNDLARQLPT